MSNGPLAGSPGEIWEPRGVRSGLSGAGATIQLLLAGFSACRRAQLSLPLGQAVQERADRPRE